MCIVRLQRLSDGQCEFHMCRDLATPKFQWDHPMLPNGAQVPFTSSEIEKSVTTSSNPYEVRCPSAAALTDVAGSLRLHTGAHTGAAEGLKASSTPIHTALADAIMPPC